MKLDAQVGVEYLGGTLGGKTDQKTSCEKVFSSTHDKTEYIFIYLSIYFICYFHHQNPGWAKLLPL